MSKQEKSLRFEDRLAQLEALTAQMEEGSLGLSELLKLYEQGSLLVQGLQKDLDAAQASLQELKDGKLKPLEQA